MTAAKYLLAKGYEVDIYESRNHIGGRCYSFVDGESGDMMDNGQHLFSGAYEEFFSLLRWLGTEHLLSNTGNINVDFVDSASHFAYKLDCTYPNNILGLLFGLWRMEGIGYMDKLRANSMLLHLLRGINGEDYSVSELFRRLGVSDIAIKRLWKPLCVSIMNAPIEYASAKLFLATLKRIISSGEMSLQNAIVPLQSLFDGFEVKIANAGSRLHLKSAVTSIDVIDNRCCSIVVNGENIAVDRVISTLPARNLTKLHPIFAEYKEWSSSPILSVYIWCDGALFDKQSICSIGTNIEWVFNCSKMQSGMSSKHLYSITMSAANDAMPLSDVELMRVIVAELRQITRITDVVIGRYKILREQNATPLLTYMNEIRRPSVRSSLSNFYFAGDWTATNLPATIESAAVSGRLVVETMDYLASFPQAKVST